MVWTSPRSGDMFNSLHPNRYCHGHHESTKQHILDLSTRLWCCFPWETRGQHGLCHLRLHLISTRDQILRRFEARPLHEDPTADPLLGSNGRNGRFINHPDHCPQLDVRQRPQNLHPKCCEWVRLPSSPCPFQRQHSLGRRRTQGILRPKRNIPRSCVVLPNRCHRPNNPLALCPQQERQYCPQDQSPRALRLPQLDPSSHRPQLLGLGSRLLRLQLCDSPESRGLVGEIHHDAQCGSRLGSGFRAGDCILWIRVPRIDGGIQVVGHGDLQEGL